MIVPFSISDFLDRAVQVYGDRTGVIDEPDQRSIEKVSREDRREQCRD